MGCCYLSPTPRVKEEEFLDETVVVYCSLEGEFSNSSFTGGDGQLVS